MEKIKLLVSFSGGETSAYMANWLYTHKQDDYDMIFIFANTGQENEQTLKFVRLCEIKFGIKVIWIETKVFYGKRKGSGFTITNYHNASREGQPFEDIIKKYGIPNSAYPHCSRELKVNPIHAYAKSIGWKNYYTAIGIREDEFDRMDPNRIKKRFVYPLIQKEFRPMTKKKINFWWSQQAFRLELKGYQGNCITCWKKSDGKLFTIAKENKFAFNFMSIMEDRYSKFIPESRIRIAAEKGQVIKLPITFFRKNRTAIDIISESKYYDKYIIDDSLENDESCDIHAQCN